MKIENPSLSRAGGVRRSGGSSGTSRGGDFAKALSDQAPAGAASHAAPLNSVNAMLALQEVPDSVTGRARARRRGEQLLDKLEAIRVGLLTGAIPRNQLEQLSEMVSTGREGVDDPRLAEVLDDIELRVAVELAKLERERAA